MKSTSQRITIDESICNGKPTIRSYRITVKTILEYLAAGETPENILEAYPFLEEADIIACIQFAAKAMDSEHYSIIAA
ncbi:DUF433 domain-containing protein [Dyadobacter sp.]|uniref:DUF433 domain-containing protein n=1 Tax=Dyadobacter sp. TaxID=1914288 RepID=UPI003F721EDA